MFLVISPYLDIIAFLGVVLVSDIYISQGYASDCIIDELEKYFEAHPIYPEKPVYRFLRITNHRVKNILRKVKNLPSNRTQRRKKTENTYRLQKFPGIELGELNDLITCYKNVSGRFSGVEIEALKDTKRCFLICNA